MCRGHRNLQAIHAGLEQRSAACCDEPIGMAGDHGQGRGFPPNDLGLGRVAGLEVACDRPASSNRCGSSSPETVSDSSPAMVLPKRSVPVARTTYVAALGQFERLAGRAVGGRGQRMLLNQFLAGGFADLRLAGKPSLASFSALG